MNATPDRATPREDLAYREASFKFREFGSPGLSAPTLATHLDLYRGYLSQSNELLAAMADLSLRRSAGGVARPRESVARRLSFELDGVKLHEWYFEQLAGAGGA